MATAPYRAVVIGCGGVGVLFEGEKKRAKPASHAGEFEQNPLTELVALVDINTKNLKAAGKLFPNARLYTSAAECFKNEQPDIVVIATPLRTHVALIKLAIAHKVKAILCEKPLAEKASDFSAIEKLCKKQGVIFVLSYQRRFYPAFRALAKDIKSGKLGRIQQATVYYSNGLRNNGGHAIDALRFVLGEEFVTAVGFSNAKNDTRPKGDANVDALLTTANGTRVVLQSFDQKAYGIFDLRILGTKGAAYVTDYGYTIERVPVRDSVFKGVPQLSQAGAKRTEEVVPPSALLNHVLKCLAGTAVSESSVADGAAVFAVCAALTKSVKAGGKVVRI